MTIIFSLFMAFLSRMAGGGWPAPWLSEKIKWDGLPEMLFGVPFGIAAFYVSGCPWYGVAAWAYTWAAMETGYGDVLGWGKAQGVTPETHPLSYIVDPLARKFGFKYYDRNYCRLYMAFKGLAVGLAIPPVGLLLFVLWPLWYEIRRVHIDVDGLDEAGTGLSSGICILLFVMLFG